MFTLVLGVVLCGILVLAVADRLQTKEPTFRVYPVVGRLVRLGRYARRVLRSPFHTEGPFSVTELEDIRKRALTGSALTAFGTSSQRKCAPPHPHLDVVPFPSQPAREDHVTVHGADGDTLIPRLNFGALGFGPVHENVVLAFGNAAKEVNCLLNTGEDGLTKYHTESGARLIWQIGTGYWTCRDEGGNFSKEQFAKKVKEANIAMVELKLTQAAKPGAGGYLPASKATARVARPVGATPNQPIVSPPHHKEFSDAQGMLNFLNKLSEASGGIPIGIKLSIGSEPTFRLLAGEMKATGIAPAFITIDGSEGGSGAATPALLGRGGLRALEAIPIVDRVLKETGLRDRVKIFAAGAIKDGYDIYEFLSKGADGCFFTRAPMVAIGCVQALDCHEGDCPAGIASQSWWRRNAISPSEQGKQLAAYYRTVIEDLYKAAAAVGAARIDDLVRPPLPVPVEVATSGNQGATR